MNRTVAFFLAMLVILAPGLTAFAQAPDGALAIQTEQLKATMTAASGWTLRTVEYGGTPLIVDAGGEGAVIAPTGNDWYGSAMKGGEKPVLLSVAVDDKAMGDALPAAVAGEKVTVKKASLIHKLLHTAQTTFEGDLIVQKHYFLALEDLKLASFYAFIYSVTPDTDVWLARTLSGDEVEGTLTATGDQVVNRDVAWVAQYDKESGKGVLCYYSTPFKGPGSATRIWDHGNYHKHFGQPFSGDMVAGAEASYTMVMKFFAADEGGWKDEARAQATQLEERFPTEEKFMQQPRLYDEGVPEDGFITAQTRDYKIVFSARQAWTIYSFTFQDDLIGHSNGFYGTVLIPVGGNFIGTGHGEGGREIVHAVKLLVDGEETPIDMEETYTGSSIQLVKDSTIHKFKAHTTITVTDDEVIERTELEAMEDFDLKLMYLFMHCWQGTTSDWMAELPDGELLQGEFDNDGNEVMKDTRWVAQYEPNMGIGILGYTPKVAAGKGSHTMIWDLERYHKYYTMRVGAQETFRTGDKLDYTMVVKGIAGEDGSFEPTKQAVELLKEKYPPVPE